MYLKSMNQVIDLLLHVSRLEFHAWYFLGDGKEQILKSIAMSFR